jgi:ribonuclease BN (tRNA processing enzyme)
MRFVANGRCLLIDCGASSLIAMKAANVDPASVNGIVVTHLHGDHFGGIPFLILDAQFSRRTERLAVAGPTGIRSRVEAAMEVFFPGSSSVERRFDIEWVELAPGYPVDVIGFEVTAAEVVHASGAPALAVRVTAAGAVVAYSGDTEWTDALVDVSAGADVFACEGYFFDKKVRYHLDYKTLEQFVPQLSAERVIVTHMAADMLDRLNDLTLEAAFDGMVIPLGGKPSSG